jgi:spore coat protein U-like protein
MHVIVGTSMVHGGSSFLRAGGKLIILGLCLVLGGSPAARAAGPAPTDGGAGNNSSIAISVGSINFGDISEARVFDGTTSITVRAPRGTLFKIALGGGLARSAGSRIVTLQDGTAGMPYQLCKDASCTLPWGDSDFDNTFPQGTSSAGQGTGADQRATVFGRLVVSSLPPPGMYHDSVLVTVYY